jgi:hypothetical protein
MDNLIEIQPNFKSELVSCVGELAKEVDSFDKDYIQVSPPTQPSFISTRVYCNDGLLVLKAMLKLT